MKKLLFLMLSISVCALFINCSDDDNDPCSQSNWLGTYSGTCNDIDYTLNVTRGGGSFTTLELILPNGSEATSARLDGCNYLFMLGALTISARLDGDTIIYEDSSEDCSPITFTRN